MLMQLSANCLSSPLSVLLSGIDVPTNKRKVFHHPNSATALSAFQSSQSVAGLTPAHLLYPAPADHSLPIGIFCSRFPVVTFGPSGCKYPSSLLIFQLASLLFLISKKRVLRIYINLREPS